MRVEDHRILGVIPVAQQALGVSAILSNVIAIIKDLWKMSTLDRAGGSLETAIRNYNNEVNNGPQWNILRQKLTNLLDAQVDFEDSNEDMVRFNFRNEAPDVINQRVNEYREAMYEWNNRNQSHIQPMYHLKEIAEGIITAIPVVGTFYNGYCHFQASKQN